MRFDDLLVGAPFEFWLDEQLELGGAVYVFYSRGERQPRGANHRVFLEPVILRGRQPHSQFGTSLAREYQFAQQTYGFTDEHLRELARNSFEASFLPADKKLELLSLFDAAVAG